KKKGFDLVLIILNPRILYEKNCLFFPHNAATKGYRSFSKEHFTGAEALERVFDNSITYQKSQQEPQTFYRKHILSPSIPTSNQAEVQVTEAISTNDILLVIDGDICLKESEITNEISRINNSRETKKPNTQPIFESKKAEAEELSDAHRVLKELGLRPINPQNSPSPPPEKISRQAQEIKVHDTAKASTEKKSSSDIDEMLRELGLPPLSEYKETPKEQEKTAKEPKKARVVTQRSEIDRIKYTGSIESKTNKSSGSEFQVFILIIVLIVIWIIFK
ncbi:TPA: DUF4433 domain-containing protein, partial [Escherichia coli]|nr:DUF4433 domain-containing protein [Escherichia coli]HCI8573114.1 DUF4433 domain-containing protein [Escherichia coli]